MDQRDLELEFHRLKADFEADLKARAEANRKEITYTKVTGWATSLIVAIFLGIQIYNSVSQNAVLRDIEARTEKLVQDTERRIDDYLTGSVPQSATIEAIDRARPDTLVGKFSIYKPNPALARLDITIAAQAVLHGESPGKLLGYEVRLAPALAEVLTLGTFDPENRAASITELTQPRFVPISPEGVLAAPEVGYWISVDRYTARSTCRELLPGMQALLDESADHEIFLRPIVEHVATPTREHRFTVEFVDNSVGRCVD